MVETPLFHFNFFAKWVDKGKFFKHGWLYFLATLTSRLRKTSWSSPGSSESIFGLKSPMSSKISASRIFLNKILQRVKTNTLQVFFIHGHLGRQFFQAWLSSRAGEPANFLAAPAPAPAPDIFFQAAPAPGFYSKRLRLRLLVFFLERLRLQGAKNTRLLPAPAPWQNILFPAN